MTFIHHLAWTGVFAAVFCVPLWSPVNQASIAQSNAQLLFTSQGKAGRINVDGTGQVYFDFSVHNQATWQPGPVFPDGKRLIFLSMEPRRDVPGKPFDEYYTQTRTHLWIHDLATASLEEICNKERLAVFVTPALLLDDDRMLIQAWRGPHRTAHRDVQ